MNVDKTAENRIESELDIKRKELGVDDALYKIPSVTTRMLVALGKHGIKTIEDLADCATDDLIGWIERENGKSTRHAGALEGFALKGREAEALIMQARFKAGWIDESALPPPEQAEADAVAEPQAHKNTLWDIKFETREEAYAPIADDLAAFKQHKKALLDELRNGRKPALKSEHFDEDKSWGDLIRLAQLYFWGEKIRQETIPAADRVKRLRQLANELRRARGMADRALQDDVGNDLFKAWFAETKIPLAATAGIYNDGSSILILIADEITEVVEGLTKLGRRTLYRRSSLQAWLCEREHRGHGGDGAGEK